MRILIIRLSSIGDVILTTPILKKLKEKHPKIIIDFIVLDKFKDAILGNPNIDNLIIFDKSKHDGLKNIIKYSKKLKKNNYDYVFDLHSKIRSRLITLSLGVKTFRYIKRALYKTILVKSKLIKYRADNTIVKNYFNAFEVLGIKYTGEDLEYNFNKNDIKKIEKYQNYVVFAPGASKNTKKWTVEGFGKLAKLINKKDKKNIILIGSKKEREECNEINKISGNVCINLAGELSLKESGALLEGAEYMVTNDSGPFHIGRGVKTKSYVIFGPTDPNMFEYDELGVLIYGEEPCSPCSLHGGKKCPKNHFNCMKNIKAEDIVKIIESK
ncbi:MAG: glycosyltransferase family 9 protein [Psychrilyobacter sp.]|nr:glycosyltransferase family 9 protein [Psychrilyobacter sp.]